MTGFGLPARQPNCFGNIWTFMWSSIGQCWEVKGYKRPALLISVSTAFLVRFNRICQLGIPGLPPGWVWAGAEAGQLELVPVHLSVCPVLFVTTSQDKNHRVISGIFTDHRVAGQVPAVRETWRGLIAQPGEPRHYGWPRWAKEARELVSGLLLIWKAHFLIVMRDSRSSSSSPES